MCDCAAKLEQIEQRLAALETGNRTKVRQDFEFELFWQSYPKKVGKKAALQAWTKIKDRPHIDDIVEAIDNAKKSDQWKKEGGQFIPNPSTWLNQGRWDDEPVQVVPVLPNKAYVKVPPRQVERHVFEPPPPEVMAVLSRIGRNM